MEHEINNNLFLEYSMAALIKALDLKPWFAEAVFCVATDEFTDLYDQSCSLLSL